MQTVLQQGVVVRAYKEEVIGQHREDLPANAEMLAWHAGRVLGRALPD